MTTNEFLNSLPIKNKTYWWAFWWIDSSFTWLNDAIEGARKKQDKETEENLCKVIALKYLYLSREQK